MTDPLSVAAGAAGLSQFAGELFVLVIKYVQGVKEADHDIKRLATELRNLSALLQNLYLLGTEMEGSADSTTVLFFRDSSLAQIEDCLRRAKFKLEKAEKDIQHGGLKRKIRLLKWPLSHEKTQELMDEIGKHRDVITVALSADSLQKLTTLLIVQEFIQQDIHEVKNGVEALRKSLGRVLLNDEKRRVTEFFSKVNPLSHLEKARKLRQENTGTWLL